MTPADYRARTMELLEVSRDDLADYLRVAHEDILREAADWRPLADRVLALVALALEKSGSEEVRAQLVASTQLLQTFIANTSGSAFRDRCIVLVRKSKQALAQQKEEAS